MGWTPLHTSAFHGQVVRCRNACMCRAACLRAPAAFRLPASTSCCSPRPMSTARSYISQPYSKPSWRYQILEEKHGCTPLMFAASSPKWVPQLVERPRSSEERSKNTVLLESSTQSSNEIVDGPSFHVLARGGNARFLMGCILSGTMLARQAV